MVKEIGTVEFNPDLVVGEPSAEEDGYIERAFTGKRSIINIDEANSGFEVSSNTIAGSVEGTITKEYSGNVDKFLLNINNIPFDGAGGSGGGNNVEVVKIEAEFGPTATVTACDKTFEELKTAALAGKAIIAVIGNAQDYYMTSMSLTFDNDHFYGYNYEITSVQQQQYVGLLCSRLLWPEEEEYPEFGYTVINLQLYTGNTGGEDASYSI